MNPENYYSTSSVILRIKNGELSPKDLDKIIDCIEEVDRTKLRLKLASLVSTTTKRIKLTKERLSDIECKLKGLATVTEPIYEYLDTRHITEENKLFGIRTGFLYHPNEGMLSEARFRLLERDFKLKSKRKGVQDLLDKLSITLTTATILSLKFSMLEYDKEEAEEFYKGVVDMEKY